MAQFILVIDTGNASFDDLPGEETARILRGVALQLEENHPYDLPRIHQSIRDTNGNKVGSYVEKPRDWFPEGPNNLIGIPRA